MRCDGKCDHCGAASGTRLLGLFAVLGVLIMITGVYLI